jgi:hypothetical protein
MAQTKQQKAGAASKGNGDDATPAEIEPLAPAEIEPLERGLLESADTAHLRFHVKATEGVAPEHLESGRFWANYEEKLKAQDIIEVSGYAGAWWAEVLVRNVQRPCRSSLELLRVYRFKEVKKPASGLPEDHDIRQDGQTGKYTGYRISDNVPLTRPCSKWQEAFKELLDHATLRAN